MFIASLGYYLIAHWGLVLIATAVVIGLGATAWFLKNLKIAFLAIGLAVVGFMYQGAVMHGIQLQMTRDAAIEKIILQGRADDLENLAIKDAAQAKTDADKITKLEKDARDTPKNNGACLPADAAGRIGRVR
jgi:hypothetical protein